MFINKQQWNSSTKKEQKLYKQRLSYKIKNQRKLKVGDLVRIASWCKNKFRLGSVVFVCSYDNNVNIQYLDKEGLRADMSRASGGPYGNLELMHENW